MSAQSVTNGSKKSFAILPPEVLVQVVAHIETAAVLSRLSQTCKRLHKFVEIDGFRVLVQTRFSSFQPPPCHSLCFWRDAARELTIYEREWDKRALIANDIRPQAEDGYGRRRHRPFSRAGQTMGFVPVIDSYETWHGEMWRSRKEVLVWGAGAELFLRSRVMGQSRDVARRNSPDEVLYNTNSHQENVRWAKYREKGLIEGRDDITSINLLPQQGLEQRENVIIGRASGGLSLISLQDDTSYDKSKVLATYETGKRPIRSTSINKSNQILAVCLSDSAVHLMPLDTPKSHVTSVGEVFAVPTISSGRTWSCCFLSERRLAVGLGPSSEPIRLYDISNENFNDRNARSLAMSDVAADTSLDSPCKHDAAAKSGATSVYALTLLPADSVSGGKEGNVFLSGAYDGLVRLHDLRTRSAVSAVFQDPIDPFTPIYSLLPTGPQRFIAGGGRHSVIKVFDLRLPGGTLYHTTSTRPFTAVRQKPCKQSTRLQPPKNFQYYYGAEFEPRGWNMYLNTSKERFRHESPVYSLSRPSQCSSSFFAGVEGSVVQLDVGYSELSEAPSHRIFEPVVFPW